MSDASAQALNTTPTAMAECRRYLRVDRSSVCFTFEGSDFAAVAQQNLLLDPEATGPVGGTITYRADRTVNDLQIDDCPPNAVLYRRRPFAPGRDCLDVRLLGGFKVCIEREGTAMLARYAPGTPICYLLDDILQAALQPIIEHLGGFMLHGACVVHDGEATVLTAASGGGKSTTAFNFLRHGFDCYADDTVLVTPARDGRLWVWPMVREISLRSLSFRMLGCDTRNEIPYRREGGKYLFRVPAPHAPGAVLQRLCLLEVGGEHDTLVKPMDRRETESALQAERRHFPHLSRGNGDAYARLLAERTPSCMRVQLGIDLPGQVPAILGGRRIATAPPASEAGRPGRRTKLALVRQAWQDQGREPLVRVIPLLGDSDLRVFEAATGFFNAYPLAQLVPLGPVEGNALEIRCRRQPAALLAWLRPHEWLEGCSALLESTSPEVIEQLGRIWLSIAPLLYPFLRASAPSASDLVAIDEAWRGARDRRPKAATDGGGAGDQAMSESAGAVRPNGGPHVIRISDRTEGAWIDWLSQHRPNDAIVALPVFREGSMPLQATVGFVRLARSLGFAPRVSRSMPLCRLAPEEAHYLVETCSIAEALQPHAETMARASTAWTSSLRWESCDCVEEGSSALGFLGFCAGGYFSEESEPRE